MINKIVLFSMLCFYAISPAFCFVPPEDEDTSGSESVRKRARVDLEPGNFLLEYMDFKDENINFTYSALIEPDLLGAESVIKPVGAAQEQGTLVTQCSLPPLLIPLRARPIFRQARPQFYNSAGESYGIHYHVIKFILSFIVDKKDIESLSLVSRGFCNWVDARPHIKFRRKITSDMALNILKNKTDLRSINICRENTTDDDDFTDSDLEVIANLFPKLASIDLFGRDVITEVGLEAVAKGCPNLTKISYDFNDSSLQAMAKGCKALTSLNARFCDVADAGLQAIAAVSPNLTDIDLRDSKVTDVGLEAIAKGCPNLTSIDLIECHSITDVGLEAIAKGCPNLTKIDLPDCDGITALGLRALLTGCQNLTELDAEFDDLKLASIEI